jgi:hypothetical protein
MTMVENPICNQSSKVQDLRQLPVLTYSNRMYCQRLPSTEHLTASNALGTHFQTFTMPSRLQDTSIRSVTCSTISGIVTLDFVSIAQPRHQCTRMKKSPSQGRCIASARGTHERTSMAARSSTASRCASAACRRRAEETPERLGPATAPPPPPPPLKFPLLPLPPLPALLEEAVSSTTGTPPTTRWLYL